MRGAPVLLSIVVAGCSGNSPGDDPPGGDPPETNARFVGEWMVDQPFHATYEASWYFFHDDGELEHLRDCSVGGPGPTGFVSDASDSVRWRFLVF